MRVAVAVSGGKDSMALLHYLSDHTEGFSLLVVHCEHGIRKDSLADARFVERYCKDRDLPFLLFQEDCPLRAKVEKQSLETVARSFRYESFDKLLKTKQADVILTAHHESDNAETILFRLSRGTSISGICGITDREGIARPMLHVTREEIDDYVTTHAIPYREDSTNTDETYTRNFIRHEILPRLEEKIPSATTNIVRFATLAKEDDEFLYTLSESLIEQNSVRIDDRFPLFSRACLSVMKRMGLDSDYTYQHLRSLYELCNKENGKMIVLPKHIVVYREYDKITFYQKTGPAIEIPFTEGELPFREKVVVIGEQGLFFDLDKIPPSAVLRTRREGDRFHPFKGHEKSLGDWMTDHKIPLAERGNIPLIADGNRVLIVIGYEISDEVKLTMETKRSRRIEYR